MSRLTGDRSCDKNITIMKETNVGYVYSYTNSVSNGLSPG